MCPHFCVARVSRWPSTKKMQLESYDVIKNGGKLLINTYFYYYYCYYYYYYYYF